MLSCKSKTKAQDSQVLASQAGPRQIEGEVTNLSWWPFLRHPRLAGRCSSWDMSGVSLQWSVGTVITIRCDHDAPLA